MRSVAAAVICLIAAALSIPASIAAAVAATSGSSGTPAPIDAAPRKQPDTLKSRLSDKASDEQRVNDCKVPAERRGPKKRPTECAGADPAPQPAAPVAPAGK